MTVTPKERSRLRRRIEDYRCASTIHSERVVARELIPALPRLLDEVERLESHAEASKIIADSASMALMEQPGFDDEVRHQGLLEGASNAMARLYDASLQMTARELLDIIGDAQTMLTKEGARFRHTSDVAADPAADDVMEDRNR